MKRHFLFYITPQGVELLGEIESAYRGRVDFSPCSTSCVSVRASDHDHAFDLATEIQRNRVSFLNRVNAAESAKVN